jgi:hypothetical protein
MLGGWAARILEGYILREFEGFIREGLEQQDAYCTTCMKCSASRYCQLLFLIVRPSNRSSLEAYVVYVLSKLLLSTGEKPFMPIIWATGNFNQLLGATEKTLVFSLHNNFSFALVTLSARGKVMGVASKPERIRELYDRSGGRNFDNVVLRTPRSFPLLNFMKDRQTTFYSCDVDQRRNRKSRIDGYKLPPFEMARRLSLPVFFASFEFTQDGNVLGHVDGPFRDKDPLELIDRFAKFVGVLKRYRIYRAPHARKKPAKN